MNPAQCPICAAREVERVARPDAVEAPGPDDVRITDAGYGRTGPLFQCGACGFQFAVFADDILAQYRAMEDEEYEEGRRYRSVQQRRLVSRLRKAAPGARTVLDVGAGTGMLVEEAVRQGLGAVGVEPSRWCVERARSRGLAVLEGVIPHPELDGRTFDAVTLVDVVEHVHDPVGLLAASRAYLKDGGHLLLVTPDVRSLSARLLGPRWWHYRVAHVGYFSKRTLGLALDRAGFTVQSVRRPCWYFEVRYLYARLRQYLPLPRIEHSSWRPLRWLFSIQVPLNLFDSLEVVACRA